MAHSQFSFLNRHLDFRRKFKKTQIVCDSSPVLSHPRAETFLSQVALVYQPLETDGYVYGVQVLATSRKMKASDAFFKGYTPLEVRSGKLYKYILVAGDDLSAVRKKKKELDKKFPGCFVVSKDGETVTRIP